MSCLVHGLAYLELHLRELVRWFLVLGQCIQAMCTYPYLAFLWNGMGAKCVNIAFGRGVATMVVVLQRFDKL